MNWYKKAQEFYRGTNPESKERIKEPFSAAIGKTFVARKPESARNYGHKIEKIVAKPEAKILYENSNEFWKLMKRKKPANESIYSAPRKGERLIDVVNEAILIAQRNGYDAISFSSDSDIGTVILNESAFVRNAK